MGLMVVTLLTVVGKGETEPAERGGRGGGVDRRGLEDPL